MKILHLDSSITGDQSASRDLSAAIVRTLVEGEPSAHVTYRDLVETPLDHITLPGFGSEASAQTLAEFKAADTIVIGAPMYNFSIPTQLKAWIDRVLVAGQTFRYTETGAVEGLAGDKTVIVALTRGGLYGADSAQRDVEHAERYLSAAFGFIGITPRFVIAEGLKIGEDAREAAMAAARAEIGSLRQLQPAA